jgi:hypothetical protein
LRDLGNRLEQFLREEPHWAAPREKLAIDMARFEWAQVVAFDGPSNPPVTPDDILDASPAKLRLGLQPYLSLLELNNAVDDFLIAVKKRESDALRGEASNAVQAAPKAAKRPKRIRPPKREKVLPRRPPSRQHAVLQTPGPGSLRDPHRAGAWRYG